MKNADDILQRLCQAQIECVLVGGFAAVVYGVTIVTRDVDVCCSFSEANLLRLQSALADLHPVHRLTPQKLPLDLKPGQCGHLNNLYITTDLGILDCISEVKGVGGYAQALQHSVPIQLPFGVFRVLDIDTLILAKEAMNRQTDQLAAAQLRAIKERIQPT
jgi:hypothetical protein